VILLYISQLLCVEQLELEECKLKFNTTWYVGTKEKFCYN